jgi:rhodanese-related sulfurtransferase
LFIPEKQMYILLVFLLILFVAIGYAIVSPYRITSQEARRRIQEGEFDVILDVRTDLERRTLGAYPGSKHIPSGELDTRISTEIPDKDASILVYCNTGQRARAAVDKMIGLGYKRVVYIAGSHVSIL